MKSLVTSCLIAICTAIPACYQVKPDNWETQAIAVDSLFSSIDTQSQPGCSVGIIYRGRFIHRGNYGTANLEYGIPLSSRSVFRIGSVSKQFTAIAILLLEEQGKLSLDADVHEYLPGLINYQSPVTLRHMLWHTSGMAEYTDADITAFKNVNGEPFRWGNEDYLSTSEFMAILSQLPLDSPPNQKFRYSNSAYFLLSQVVEAVSGQSLRQFAQENIFEPLKMETSSFNDNVNRVITDRATGYRPSEKGKYEIFETNLAWVGDGGIYTTIDDFILWDQNYYYNRLGNGDQTLIELMESPSAHTREKQSRLEYGYGFGLESSLYKGLKRVGHAGQWVAFNSHYARFPDLQFSVVAFCNTLEVNATDITNQIIDIYLARLLDTSANPPLQ